MQSISKIIVPTINFQSFLHETVCKNVPSGYCRWRVLVPDLAVLSTKGVKSTLRFLLMLSSIVPPEDWHVSFIWPTFFNQLINSWQDFSLKHFLQGELGIILASVRAAGYIGGGGSTCGRGCDCAVIVMAAQWEMRQWLRRPQSQVHNQ